MPEITLRELEEGLNDVSWASISHFTLRAREGYPRHVKETVATVVARIKTAPPEQKLPVWYLVDSILKRLGGEFVVHLEPHLCALAQLHMPCESPSLGAKFSEMIATWEPALAVETFQSLREIFEQKLSLTAKQFPDASLSEPEPLLPSSALNSFTDHPVVPAGVAPSLWRGPSAVVDSFDS
eukprot:RCo020956